MWVYGDQARQVDPRDHLARIEAASDRSAAMPAGVVRHGEAVTALILAGELLQGVADARFDRHGQDGSSEAVAAATALAMSLARTVRLSWESGFETLSPSNPELFARVRGAGLPDTVTVKEPEGYAFYALYPEAYLTAAKALPRTGPVRVIGIRSIGTGLAALVAEAVGAEPPVTVRPFGHPFRRRIALAPGAEANLLSDPGACFAIVDEGPGLSGSSFGAVADWLEERGVARDRIHFLPGHGGDLGHEACPRHRERWASAARHVVAFEALVLRAPNPAHRLDAWATDLIGEPVSGLEDISGGAWRRLQEADEASWPPALAAQERRKFLMRTGSGTWLLKFTGLGAAGRRKLRLAERLAEAGFTPPVRGLRHGFLVERWVEGARPLDPAEDQPGLVAHLGRYLGFRARHLPAETAGAPLDILLAMARHNAGLALGEAVASRLDRSIPHLPPLAADQRPIAIDGRLHAHEWLRLADGRLLKTDAVDHHAAHDLVGPQDVAWDVAGAIVEFALSPAEQDQLCLLVEAASGRAVGRDLVALLRPCYLAFQLGSCTMAASALAGWPDEARRLTTAADAYAEKLRSFLVGA